MPFAYSIVDYIPWIVSRTNRILGSVNTRAFETLQRALAEEVKSARRRAGLSQEALALAAEVDRSYVSQLERGVANPSLLILWRLAQTLDTDITVCLTAHSGD